MQGIAFLILFPILIGIVLYFVRSNGVRRVIVLVGGTLICLATIFLLTTHFDKPIIFFNPDAVYAGILNKSITYCGFLLDIFIFYMAVRYKRFSVLLLAVIQTLITIFFEYKYGDSMVIENYFFVDKFSILMAMIIGILGPLISIFSLEYMKKFHEDFKNEISDKRHFFFSIIFIFLGAMFGLVLTNSLKWMFFFWEITTLCSFFMIAYKGNEESIKNAFRALLFNIIGGMAFALGLFFLAAHSKPLEIDKIMLGNKDFAIMLPISLFAIAGLTKSAQFPFQSWLLGAMVAPTPVSALLHSSTMVKAGVYIIVRFSRIFEGTNSGLMLIMLGGLSFLTASLAAIPQDDAKKVLAYSTIANLGLVVLCAGLGTCEAVWGALFLIIFHAVSKCLLFLSVGTVEHKIHSRDIENMDGLIIKMPKLAIILQVGMAGMFLPPFGMLISKWAVLKAMVDKNAVLCLFIIFGGAATMLFWIKWIGKLIIVPRHCENIEKDIKADELIPLSILAVLTAFLCLFFPLLSSYFVEPYVEEIYGVILEMSLENAIIMAIMMSLIFLFPMVFLHSRKKTKLVGAFLCGTNTGHDNDCINAFGKPSEIKMSNYYMTEYFQEKGLIMTGYFISIILIFSMLGFAVK
jgi:ech hydrogenase subunit A